MFVFSMCIIYMHICIKYFVCITYDICMTYYITYVLYIYDMIIYAFVCTSIKYATKLFRALLKAICADFIATAQLFASQKRFSLGKSWGYE